MYSRSPAAYQALRGFKLLQLPCVRTLKYYIDSNLESAGDSMERLQQCRVQYNALIEEKKKILEENSNKGDNYYYFSLLGYYVCVYYVNVQDVDHTIFCPLEKVL